MYRFKYLIFGLFVSGAFAVDLAKHQIGVWAIESTQDMSRWVIIHNLESAESIGLYHIEVIGRKHGNAAWQVERLVHHMAVTEKALKASIKEPLEKGGVYPESFNNAFSAWQQKKKRKRRFHLRRLCSGLHVNT